MSPKGSVTSYPSQAESELDPAAWVDQFGDRLFGIALSKVRDRSIAEDLVQDTFLSALKGIDKFEGRSSIDSWLQSILRNKIIDYFRGQSAKVPHLSLEETNEFSSLPFNALGIWNKYVSNWAHTPEKVLEDQQFMSVLQSCIDKLPASQRSVFELKFRKELDQEDICKAAGVSPSNYWVILHRARLALRDCIEKNWVLKR